MRARPGPPPPTRGGAPVHEIDNAAVGEEQCPMTSRCGSIAASPTACPVVPPSRARVDAMLAATTRPPRRAGGAGAAKLRPRDRSRSWPSTPSWPAAARSTFPVVLAVVEAACDPVFNLHGQSGTTNAASPLIIINGPIRRTARGQLRGRRLRPGLPRQRHDRARAAPGDDQPRRHPSRPDLDVDHGPSRPLHLLHRRVRGGVTLGAAIRRARVRADREHGDALLRRGTVHDQRSPEPIGIAAGGLARMVGGRHLESQELSALRPHAVRHRPGTRQNAREERWSKQDFRRFLYDTIRRPARDLAPGPDGAETGRLKDLLDGRTGEERIPKFPSLEEIVIVVAGGTAGRFSAVVPGWMGGELGSRPVTRAIGGRG